MSKQRQILRYLAAYAGRAVSLKQAQQKLERSQQDRIMRSAFTGLIEHTQDMQQAVKLASEMAAR